MCGCVRAWRIDGYEPSRDESGFGEVAKRSNAADCKSVALGLRRFESFPRHQPSLLDVVPRSVGWRASSRPCGGRRLGIRMAVRSQVFLVTDGGLTRRSRAEVDGRSRRDEGGSNSVVESQPSKLLVAGSIPVSRSSLRSRELRRSVSFGQASPAKVGLAEAATGEGGP